MYSHNQTEKSSPLAAKLVGLVVIGGIFWFMLALFDALFDLGSTTRSRQSSIRFVLFFFAVVAGVVVALNASALDPFHILTAGWIVYWAIGAIFIAPDM